MVNRNIFEKNVKRVITTHYHFTYLITSDNKLYVCGNNINGQLGLGNTGYENEWVEIKTIGVTDFFNTGGVNR